MAIGTPTKQGTTKSVGGGGSTTIVSDAFTPSEGDLVIVSWYNQDNDSDTYATPVPSDDFGDSGGTDWVVRDRANSGDSRQGCGVAYRIIGSGASSGSVTLTDGDPTETPHWAMIVHTVTGVDTTTPEAESFDGDTGGVFETSWSDSFASVESDNLLWVVTGYRGTGVDITADTGWTEEEEFTRTFPGPDMTLHLQSRTGTTSTDAGATNDNDEMMYYVGVEFQAAAAGGGETFEKLLTEAITVSEDLVRRTDKTLAEAVALSDAARKQVARVIAESIAAGDARTLTAMKALQEAVDAADTVQARAVFVKVLTETITASAGLQKLVSLVRVEAILAGDVVRKTVGLVLGEDITLSDVLDAVETGGELFQKVLTETVTASAAQRRTTMKQLEEQVAASAGLRKLVAVVRLEAVAVQDLVSKAAAVTFTDAVSVGDVVSAATVVVVTLLESVGVTEARRNRVGKALGETVSTATGVRKAVGKVISDGISVAASPFKRIAKVLADAIGVSDAVTAGETGAFTTLEMGSRQSMQETLEARQSLQVPMAARQSMQLDLDVRR